VETALAIVGILPFEKLSYALFHVRSLLGASLGDDGNPSIVLEIDEVGRVRADEHLVVRSGCYPGQRRHELALGVRVEK